MAAFLEVYLTGREAPLLMKFNSMETADAMYDNISEHASLSTPPNGPFIDDDGWRFGFRMSFIEAMVVRSEQ